MRERKCTNPFPAYGGLNCTEQGFGAAEETSSCNEHPCPGRKTLITYFFHQIHYTVVLL